MSSLPECKRCGDYVHYGPVLCEACLLVQHRKMEELEERLSEFRRTCDARRSENSALEAKNVQLRSEVDVLKAKIIRLREVIEKIYHYNAGHCRGNYGMKAENWINNAIELIEQTLKPPKETK